MIKSKGQAEFGVILIKKQEIYESASIAHDLSHAKWAKPKPIIHAERVNKNTYVHSFLFAVIHYVV